MGIELILMRQLAGCLAMPIILSDTRGDVVYVNESAEQLLGLSVGESDTVSAEDLASILSARGCDGRSLRPDEMPTRRAMVSGRPVHQKLQVRGSGGVDHWLQATAFPLLSTVGEHVGVVSILWDAPREG